MTYPGSGKSISPVRCRSIRHFRFMGILLLLLGTAAAKAQQLLKNGTFDNGAANWTTACTTVEANYPETTYGGSTASNKVAEIDDESCFYQDICILPGVSYIFSMKASRRSGSTPATLTTRLKIEGLDASGAVVAPPLVNMDIVRSNTTFNLTTVTGIPVLNTSSASGIVRFRIKLADSTAGTSTLGMIIDDLSLSYVTPPKIISQDTLCQNPGQVHSLSISNLPASGITYDWDLGAGAAPPTSTAASPSVSWNTAGVKQVQCLLGNGVCVADTLRKNIYVEIVFPPQVVSPINYCTGEMAAPLTASGTGLLWYTSASGGTGSPTAPVPSTAAAGAFTYYVSQTIGICESQRVAIVVNVYQGASAAFSYDVHYGCAMDTVYFTNLSTGATSYTWSFGDGIGDAAVNPTHIYNTQGLFTVRLVSGNQHCRDSIEQVIDLVHPLDASFTTDKDTICMGEAISFSNTSTTTSRGGIDPTWSWDFGNGDTSTLQNPVVTFPVPGTYEVRMAVRDFVPCYDTAFKTIVVDSMSFADFTMSDSSICRGQAIIFSADYLPAGNTGLSWDFGDGTGIAGTNPVRHSYDSAGTYTVTFSASYRICPDTGAGKEVTIRPFPKLDLGPDTVICLNGEPVVLTAVTDPPGLSDVRWSTNDTAAQILVRHHGTFFARVDLDGCAVSDTVEVRKDCYIDVPNAFTPNGDGVNDFFFPRQFLSKRLSRFRMQVFNRWGQLVFETDRTDGRGWDGRFNNTDQPQGVYVYLIEAELAGTRQEKYQGNVTLIR